VDDETYANLADEVDALLDRLGGLDDGDVRALGGLWAREDAKTRERGWRTAKAAIRRRGVEDLLDEAREAVRGWASPTGADYPGFQVEVAMPSTHLEPRRAAVPAVLDAVVGALARDELPDDEYEALSRPWATVAGELEDQAADGR
jgi:hypothetical protein